MPALANLVWPLRTSRLVIRPATDADLLTIGGYRSQPGVSEWLPSAPVDAAAFRERLLEKQDPDKLTLALEYDGQVVGDLYVGVKDAWAQAEVADRAGQEGEVGWCLAPSVQGRGLATEACTALLRLCLAPPPDGLGLRRVFANTFAANEPSWRLMERLGMRRESHTVRDGLHRSGEWLDGLTYALLADEWATR